MIDDMLYSIINTKSGEQKGLLPHLHRLVYDGQKMVVNENELRLVNPDIELAASTLGGVVMTQGDVINELKKDKK